MKTETNQCSNGAFPSCPPGAERHVTFGKDGREWVQYDYRTPAGVLFSCVAPDLARARQRRDLWLDRAARQSNPLTCDRCGQTFTEPDGGIFLQCPSCEGELARALDRLSRIVEAYNPRCPSMGPGFHAELTAAVSNAQRVIIEWKERHQ